jgi:hypothetical protein
MADFMADDLHPQQDQRNRHEGDAIGRSRAFAPMTAHISRQRRHFQIPRSNQSLPAPPRHVSTVLSIAPKGASGRIEPIASRRIRGGGRLVPTLPSRSDGWPRCRSGILQPSVFPWDRRHDARYPAGAAGRGMEFASKDETMPRPARRRGPQANRARTGRAGASPRSGTSPAAPLRGTVRRATSL